MNFVFFAIEGPIGVGKSALLDALEKEYGRHVLHSFREESGGGSFLSQFYEDKRKYAFQTQVSFMLSRYKQCEAFQKSIKQPDMFAEHRIYATDFIFEKNDIFAELTIEDEQEWKLYQNMRDILLESSKVHKTQFCYLPKGRRRYLIPQSPRKAQTNGAAENKRRRYG
jgi:deoxyguanosine kinase